MDLRGITEFFKDFMWYIIVLLVIAFVLVFIVAFQTVAGNSMDPTLKDGQIVLVSKLPFKPKRNEIVLFKSNGKSYVKRVIGLPGEKIEYLDGILYINNQPFKESYLDANIETFNFLFSDVCPVELCKDGVIPENEYFVMGDNRPESADSRDPKIGLINKENMKGKVVYSIVPLRKVK